MVWNTSPYVLVETEELVQHGQNFMMKEFLRCTLWSLWWLNLGALLVHTPDNCHLFPQRILHLIFFSTRPKPAYGLQGLDWIVGPGYSFVVFSTNKTMETHQKP